MNNMCNSLDAVELHPSARCTKKFVEEARASNFFGANGAGAEVLPTVKATALDP